MIDIYKKSDEGLEKIDTIQKDCWINAVEPNYVELSEISKTLGIPEEFLTDPLDVDERARIEVEDGYILIILRVPFYDREHPEVPYNTVPLGIIYSENSIVTISSRENDILSSFKSKKMKNLSLKNKEKFIFLIFLRSAIMYLKYLRQISNLTNNLENELHKSMKNQELIRLLDLEKSLVFFTTALKANEIMIGRLSSVKKFKINSDDKDLLDDVIIEYRQAIEMANVYSNILSGMMDAFASVISNNLNVVMKFLTSISIILMFPTLVASIYGMNVALPFQNSPHAFLITMVMSFGLSFIGVLLFVYRRWF
ncbi:MAG: magnesium transporter CorA family protein [Victivallales bacterium]|nr:magnesium transporter CorA family protein [Victivallales bacterium]